MTDAIYTNIIGRVLCRLGIHSWKYGFDAEVDIFGWFKRCRRCLQCRSGIAIMREAQNHEHN